MVAASQFTDQIEKLVVWGANSYINQKDMTMVEGVRDVSKVCYVKWHSLFGR